MSAPEKQLTPVDVFAPWAGDEERALRLRIHRARDAAQARAARSKNGKAREVYWVAGLFAGDWVFRRVEELGDLERVLRGLSQLFMAADNIFQLEGPDGE